MTEPITNAKPVQAKAYVQAEGGINNYVNSAEMNLGATLGGQISKGKTYAGAEVGCGTAFKAKAEIGHEFDISKNMGLELSANAKYVQSTKPTELNQSVDISTEHLTLNTKWHDGIKKAGGAMMMSFHGKKANVKAGLEMGAYTNTAPNISNEYNIATNSNEDKVTYQYEGRHSGFYATPKVAAELNLGKKGNWSLVADADKFGANAGIRFNF